MVIPTPTLNESMCTELIMEIDRGMHAFKRLPQRKFNVWLNRNTDHAGDGALSHGDTGR